MQYLLDEDEYQQVTVDKRKAAKLDAALPELMAWAKKHCSTTKGGYCYLVLNGNKVECPFLNTKLHADEVCLAGGCKRLPK